MKKILVLMLALVMIFSMFSCDLFGGSSDNGDNNENSGNNNSSGNGGNNSNNNNNNSDGVIEGPLVDWELDE